MGINLKGVFSRQKYHEEATFKTLLNAFKFEAFNSFSVLSSLPVKHSGLKGWSVGERKTKLLTCIHHKPDSCDMMASNLNHL